MLAASLTALAIALPATIGLTALGLPHGLPTAAGLLLAAIAYAIRLTRLASAE